MEMIEKARIPVLSVFGERDTQVDLHQGMAAYSEALEAAGNPKSLAKLLPEADHNILLARTGCLNERRNRSAAEWWNYPAEYLDTIEHWLRSLP